MPQEKERRDELIRVAAKAVLLTNGMLMVFDQFGEQFENYQGLGKEMIPKLRADFPECPISGIDWNVDVRPGLDQERRGG